MILLDAAAAAVILVPPALGGLWLAHLLRLNGLIGGPAGGNYRGSLRWHVLLGAALGIGGLSVLVLLLGLAGVFNRPLWVMLLSASTVAGIVRLRALLYERRTKDPSGTPNRLDQPRWVPFFWLLAVPFTILALSAAANAPGIIWSEEGFGYDVLEYHLQIPKDYVQAGHIVYLPQNVYANFPANVEMLYLLAMIVLRDVYDIGTTANMMHLLLGALAVFAAWTAGKEWSRLAGMIAAMAVATSGWLSYLSGLAYVENGMLFFGMTATAVLCRTMRRGRGEGSPGHRPVDARSPRASGPNAERRRGLVVAGLLAGLAGGCKYVALPLIGGPLLLLTVVQPRCRWRGRIGDAGTFAFSMLLAVSPWLTKNQWMTGNPVFPLLNAYFDAAPRGWGPHETQQWDQAHAPTPDEDSLQERLRALWTRVVADKYQRFGPAIFLLALGGLIGRRREWIDWLLLIMLGTQVAIWLFATHLFARFAVVLLIPLGLLCGRAVCGSSSRLRQSLCLAVLGAGAAWNLAFAWQLHRAESPAGAPASLIYEGNVPAFAYLGYVNQKLPSDAKILLVGEARAFYFQRDVDYCVAFNRNPFFVAARAAKSPADLLRWLRARGYTHVLVNWSEIDRIASTYGFSPPMTRDQLTDIFARLSTVGLRRIRSFPHPTSGRPYVDLYEIPSADRRGTQSRRRLQRAFSSHGST